MTMTNPLPSWASVLLGVVMMSVSTLGLDQAQSAEGSLDEFLAEELDYNAEKIDHFKQNIADMSPEQLQSLLQSMKFQRDLQDRKRDDINARDRKRRLKQNRHNIKQLANAKSSAERFRMEDYRKYWNYGYKKRRKYRALFYRHHHGGHGHHGR